MGEALVVHLLEDGSATLEYSLCLEPPAIPGLQASSVRRREDYRMTGRWDGDDLLLTCSDSTCWCLTKGQSRRVSVVIPSEGGADLVLRGIPAGSSKLLQNEWVETERVAE